MPHVTRRGAALVLASLQRLAAGFRSGRGKPGLRSSARLRRANRLGPLASAAALSAALLLAGCASLRRGGLVDSLQGVVHLDRTTTPAAVYLEDPKAGRWRLEGTSLGDLRELDRAQVQVYGLGEPRDPRAKKPGLFTIHAYRLVEVGGRPALVGKLAWEGTELILVELDRDDQRVPLAGPMVGSLPPLMGKAIWVAGQARQGVFVVERYGVLRQ